MAYKHGIYGGIKASEEAITSSKSTPVYIGTAPMYRLPENEQLINKPILINNYEEAMRKTGYSSTDDFNKFTLSAAIFAHFENKIQPIGPIVVINVLDNKSAKDNTTTVNMVNGVGKIEEYVLRNSVKIADKTEDKDYTLGYDSNGYLLINAENSEQISVSYKNITPEVEDEAIIGKYDNKTEERTGIEAIENIYEDLKIIPTMIAAPYFSQKPEVNKALLKKTKGISDKWQAIAAVDIDNSEATTIENAIKWKEDNSYISNEEKVLWPMGNMDGRAIPLSIIFIVAKMQTDVANKDVPYQTASNKHIDISGLYVGEKKTIKISQERANKLNEVGITTAIFNNGNYVLWGDHMGNYQYGLTSKPEDIFDTNIIMEKFLINDFQRRNSGTVDAAMSKNEVDSLLNTEQTILNSYVSAGQLLYGEIKFTSKDNPVSDIINGDFIFNTLVTTTPIGKSITNNVQYTSKGIIKEYGEEQ